MPESPPARAVTRVSVVGRGRLGAVLAPALARAGYTVYGPTGRGDEIADADIAMLCVPDRQIRDAAAAASARARVVGHTSGATGLDDVDFGLHPLQTFAGGEEPDVFEGIGAAIGGRTLEARALARDLAAALGMHPFEIADGDRALYHAAAAFASNFLVTLEDVAERVLTSAAPGSDARALLAPLVRRTVENWAASGATSALTGPVARGDHATVAAQRTALAAELPDLVPLFDVLVAHTGTLAERSHR
ncbi:DUF2520 domain-containing protein [Microbacterium protaetiae]|uniref:DUF2520 domain-containing protein n=1 Tax=Microbacterium protaetiae TaxID=2509458 RepID=A0A4P6EIQ7_9MICO|nr:DUF2520 domain-containing protein [Microbacterium protaetiae]QAY60057.1 DUF2520 domain-containing protein [Microbacterium protaetiae]